MNALIITGIVGGACLVAVAVIASMRRRSVDDLGSVSAAWTTQHNAGYRGGDSSGS